MSEATDAEAIVTALLAAAQLSISAEEKEQIVEDYPLLRAGADALYLPELEAYEPALKFNPLEFYPV